MKTPDVDIPDRIEKRINQARSKGAAIRDKVTRPHLTEEQYHTARLYSILWLAAGITALGGSSALAGIVLLAMMAVANSVLGVVGAAAMVSFGLVIVGSMYLWFVGPASR